MKILYAICLSCLTLSAFAQQDTCKISQVKTDQDAKRAQECIKIVIADMEQLLGLGNELLKRRIQFIEAAVKQAEDCKIIERSFLNKEKGLPYNRAFSKTQLTDCQAQTIQYAVALSNLSKSTYVMIQETGLTKEALEALRLKLDQLTAFVALLQVRQ